MIAFFFCAAGSYSGCGRRGVESTAVGLLLPMGADHTADAVRHDTCAGDHLALSQSAQRHRRLVADDVSGLGPERRLRRTARSHDALLR